MNNIEEHNRSETPARASRRAGGSGILARSGLLAMCMGLILTAQVRAVDPSLDVGDWALDSTSRTLPKVLNTAVNIGDFTFNVGAGNLVISVNVASTGYSVAKRYVIPTRWNLWGGTTSNTWLKVLPTHDNGPWGVSNFDLDIKVVNNVMSVRLRVSGTDGVYPGTANIAIESTGVTNVAFSSASAVVVPPTAAQVFTGNVLTQVNGRVGVNTVPSNDAALDINGGDTQGLRIRPRSVAGFPATGTWSVGALIVDSAGALYLCTAAGTPGTWKKVTP